MIKQCIEPCNTNEQAHNAATEAAFVTALLVVRPYICIIYGRTITQPNNPRKQLMLRSLQQSNIAYAKKLAAI